MTWNLVRKFGISILLYVLFWGQVLFFVTLMELPMVWPFPSLAVMVLCGIWNFTIGVSLSFVGLAPEIPENLYHLIKKAVSIRKPWRGI